MSSDSSSPQRAAGSGDDSGIRLTGVHEVTKDDGSVETRYEYLVDPRTPSFSFEHDTQKRLFKLTGAEGKTEYFRDNPARHLVVEPDPETGELRPAIKRGRPVYIYLCREEREHH